MVQVLSIEDINSPMLIRKMKLAGISADCCSKQKPFHEIQERLLLYLAVYQFGIYLYFSSLSVLIFSSVR
jgi:hypothetical protein